MRHFSRAGAGSFTTESTDRELGYLSAHQSDKRGKKGKKAQLPLRDFLL